jgi:hypothetical protein
MSSARIEKCQLLKDLIRNFFVTVATDLKSIPYCQLSLTYSRSFFANYFKKVAEVILSQTILAVDQNSDVSNHNLIDPAVV